MIFDTHAHYDSGGFNADREEIVAALPGGNVGLVVNPGCDVESSRVAVELAEKYPHVYAAVGIHPGDCAGTDEAAYEALRELAKHEKVVAIGEIGLDYYWESNPPKEFQQEVFRRQIELALELDLPVCVHDREAHGDSLAMVLEYPNLRGVFHCFSGSVEMARELWKLGWYVGFDGPLTYKNAKKVVEVAKEAPLDLILLETDAPYMAPVPVRGTRNDSRNLVHLVRALASLRGMSEEEVAAQTTENGKRLFGIK